MRENGGDGDRTILTGNATLAPVTMPHDVVTIVKTYAQAVTS